MSKEVKNWRVKTLEFLSKAELLILSIVWLGLTLFFGLFQTLVSAFVTFIETNTVCFDFFENHALLIASMSIIAALAVDYFLKRLNEKSYKRENLHTLIICQYMETLCKFVEIAFFLLVPTLFIILYAITLVSVTVDDEIPSSFQWAMFIYTVIYSVITKLVLNRTFIKKTRS